MVADFMHLPPRERLKQYLTLAEDARAEANRAKGPARETYLRIAGQWERLAARLKDTIGVPKEPARAAPVQRTMADVREGRS